MENLKKIVNEIGEPFERYYNQKCSYDRALEDAACVLTEHLKKRPVVGYIRSNTLQENCFKIYQQIKASLKQQQDENVSTEQIGMLLNELMLSTPN